MTTLYFLFSIVIIGIIHHPWLMVLSYAIMIRIILLPYVTWYNVCSLVICPSYLRLAFTVILLSRAAFFLQFGWHFECISFCLLYSKTDLALYFYIISL